MDSSGIDIKGSRIKINDQEVWARDDIFYSLTTPSNYPSDRDWVWIRPNPNVSADFYVSEMYVSVN